MSEPGEVEELLFEYWCWLVPWRGQPADRIPLSVLRIASSLLAQAGRIATRLGHQQKRSAGETGCGMRGS